MFINRRTWCSCSKMNYYVRGSHYLFISITLLFGTVRTKSLKLCVELQQKMFYFRHKTNNLITLHFMVWTYSEKLTKKNCNCKNKQHVQVGTSKFCEASIQRKRTVYKTKMLSSTFHSANTFCLIIHFLDLIFLQSHLLVE